MRRAALAATVLLLVSMPSSAFAFWPGFPFAPTGESATKGIPVGPVTLCQKTIRAAGIAVPVFIPGRCRDTQPPPPPPPPPVAPTVDLSADSTTIAAGSSTALTWDSTNAISCAASGGWSGTKTTSGTEPISPATTTAYSIECIGGGGATTDSVTVTVTPAPEPEPEPEPESDVVINEIAWAGTVIGTTTDSAAEWIELKNRGGSAADLLGWALVAEDGAPSISISGACANTSIPAGGFFTLVRTNDSILGVSADCVYAGALENGGEVLTLRDAASTTVDVVDGTGWTIGGNATNTVQRAADDTWFTAPPTPGA